MGGSESTAASKPWTSRINFLILIFNSRLFNDSSNSKPSFKQKKLRMKHCPLERTHELIFNKTKLNFEANFGKICLKLFSLSNSDLFNTLVVDFVL